MSLHDCPKGAFRDAEHEGAPVNALPCTAGAAGRLTRSSVPRG